MIEPRAHPSAALRVLAPAGAVVAALALCAALIAWTGTGVGEAYALLFQGALGSRFALAETLTRATPLMLTGLGIYLLLAMAISWADRHTGSFGKFYLFRPAALTLLLACLASVLLVRTVRQPDMVQIKRILIFGIIGLFLGNVALQFVLKVRSGLSPSGLETIAAVQALTEPRDVVVVEPIGDIDIKFVGLHRLLDRPTLVSWKFVPTNADEIHRWWGLVQWREALFRKGCDGEGIPARYILVLRPETLPVIGSCGTLAWTNGMQALVRVSR